MESQVNNATSNTSNPKSTFQNSLMGKFDHIVSHFDGNIHDRDDIAALPMAALLTNATGFQNKSTFFYNNNLGEKSLPERVALMRKSAAFAEKLGIQTYDYEANTDLATQKLVDILDSGKKVLAIEGGPMEAIYRALEQVSPENRKNVTLLSHSRVNENHNAAPRPDVDDVRTWGEIEQDFPEVDLIEIRDQNGGFANFQWKWLDSTTNPIVKEARTLMRNAGERTNDTSDAGMHFYALTGDDSGNPLDAQALFEEYAPSVGSTTPQPMPAPQPDPIPSVAPTPDTDKPSSSGADLLQLALVDAETNEVVKGFEDLTANSEIDLSQMDLSKYNIVAQVNPTHSDAEKVKSIQFESPLGDRTENVKPYALFGDNQGDFDGKSATLGDYALKATAYTETKGQGTAIATTDLTYTISNGDGTVPPSPAPKPDPKPVLEPTSTANPTPKPTPVPTSTADEPINSIEDIVGDMEQPHDAKPSGVPPYFDWAFNPRMGLGNDPGNFKSIIAWGQVYEDEAGSPSNNTRVQIRDMQTYLLSKKDGKWHLIQDSAGVKGSAFKEDFGGHKNVPADVRQESDGSVSVKLTPGYNYHFWPTTGRTTIDPKDVAGVYTTAQARLVVDNPKQPDDRNKARFLMNVGADYWLNNSVGWGRDVHGDVAIGRFRYIDSQWDAFNMTSLSEAEIRKNPPPIDDTLVSGSSGGGQTGEPDAESPVENDVEPNKPVPDLVPEVGDNPDSSPEPDVTPEPDVAPGSDASEDQPLLKFALVDADTDAVVKKYQDLSANSEINLNEVDLTKYNLVAEVNSNHPDAGKVKSVKFESPLGDRTENVEPYALFGDSKGDFAGKTLKVGDYTLKATAFTQSNGQGSAIAANDLSYTVTKAGSTPGIDPGDDPGANPVPTPVPEIDPTPSPTPNAPPKPAFTDSLMAQFDHVISHFDGNNNDRDDIAALPIAALITNGAGFQNKSTFFYNNNLGEPSLPMRVEAMRESAAFAEKLGIKTYDYDENSDKATAELIKILNSGKKVLAIEGGPMEAIYRALEQVSPANQKNVTLLSHSSWNEQRDIASREGINNVHTWQDIRNDFPNVTLLEIRDQNGAPSSGFNNSEWTWLDAASEPLLKEARELMRNAATKVNDPSDAGMHFYAITGNEEAEPSDAKTFFNQYPPATGSAPMPDPVTAPTPNPVITPTPDPVVTPPPDPMPKADGAVFQADKGQLVIEAESTQLAGNWQSVTVDGEEAVLWDANNSSYGKVPAGQTLSYQFETDEGGNYSIALHSARMKSAMNAGDRYENGSGGAERSDTGNDAYVAVTNAETGEVVQAPTKLFTGLGSSDQDFKWGTTFDANHKKSAAQVSLEANTQYQLEITGRSDGYVLDRITLSNDGALKDANAPESPLKGMASPVPTPGPKPSPTPSPAPSPTPEPSGSGETLFTFALVNAETNAIVDGYEDLASLSAINLNDLDFTKFNLVAQVNPDHPEAGAVQSIKFETSLGDRTENLEPYAIFGDNKGDFNGKSLAIGNYTVKATAYSEDGGQGGKLDSMSMTFAVEDLEDTPRLAGQSAQLSAAIAAGDTLTGIADSQLAGEVDSTDPLTNFAATSNDLTGQGDLLMSMGDSLMPLDMAMLSSVDAVDTTAGIGDTTDASVEDTPFQDELATVNTKSPLTTVSPLEPVAI